jgi:hypothetical protein
MFAFKGEKINPSMDDVEPLYFRTTHSHHGGYDGTIFTLGGRFKVLNPDTNPQGTRTMYLEEVPPMNYFEKEDGEHYFDFSKHPSERWAVELIEHKAPAMSRNPDGTLRGRANLIGVEDANNEKADKSLVRVIPVTTFSTMYGVINNSVLFRGYRRGSGTLEKYISPPLWMTWDSFKKAIRSYVQPEEVNPLPIGTRLKLPTTEEAWYERAKEQGIDTSDKMFKLALETLELDDGSFNEYVIVLQQPANNQYMGAIGNRTSVDVWPEPSERKVASVKRARARKPPFKVKRVSYSGSGHGYYGQFGGYNLFPTRSGKPNMMKSKSRGERYSLTPQLLHWLLRKGLITVDGRYSGKAELKSRAFLGHKKLKRKFDYTRTVPDPYDLKP